MKETKEYKRLKRVPVHKGHIIDVYTDTMSLPNGKTADWDYIHHKGAAAIVPVDAEGKIIMVRQYRNAVEKYTLEIPAGGLNPGEDMKSCAARELEEETGYRSDKVEHLFDLYTTVAFCNEKIGIFYTKDLIPTRQNLDEDEFVTIERYSLAELVQFIFDGTIEDAKTIAAILAYKTKVGL
ncbi:ADP-ribose pyrophosphatase [Anaerocolumna cellulosilytica]|uniref:ADP-ribose pyrophosphatase n=1 Tax=Anaerocolumna cellulosilytica TaxID=433286 RepID=A0A6S6R8N8_9FIRM|nr:NUDIX hydrolase [Anaerocolumna cellulosilytica]MBB5197108.1 ADP-ribose pyrophosphatase [Anaerocolumna cellulosilytica]BCJ95321.1 ADP-ribose pyrophosphatase [Anaerocolumna cellulosilytica]